MAARDDVDLANLPWFVAHLGDRDAGLAGFVRHLLDAGWEVSVFWGPLQMDVWSLVLRREKRLLRFGIERGLVDGLALGTADGGPPDFHPLSYAVLGWARSCGAALALDDPDHFAPDVARYGPATLAWLDAGGDETVDRIRAAWEWYLALRYSRDQVRGAEWLSATRARGVAAIEEAAARPA